MYIKIGSKSDIIIKTTWTVYKKKHIVKSSTFFLLEWSIDLSRNRDVSRLRMLITFDDIRI